MQAESRIEQGIFLHVSPVRIIVPCNNLLALLKFSKIFATCTSCNLFKRTYKKVFLGSKYPFHLIFFETFCLRFALVSCLPLFLQFSDDREVSWGIIHTILCNNSITFWVQIIKVCVQCKIFSLLPHRYPNVFFTS